MKRLNTKILTVSAILLGLLSTPSAYSAGTVTLTIEKNDTYASICSRNCESVESCFQLARRFDLNAGKKGLLKRMSIKANGKTLLNRVYRR